MKKKFRFAFISNLITLIVSLFIFKPFFEETDDTWMAFIIEGTFGKSDAHDVFSHYFLSSLEKGLQGIFTSVRMHSVLQYLFLFMGICLVSYVILRVSNSRLLTVIWQAAAFYEVYVSLQFTKTAAFTAGCALLVVLILLRDYCKSAGRCSKDASEGATDKLPSAGRVFEDKKELKVVKILALVIFTYGCMLRYDGALVSVCILAVAGACTFIRMFASWDKGLHFAKAEDKKWRAYISSIAIVLGIFLLTAVTNNLFYGSNGWAEYTDYNKTRALMVDNRCDAFDYTRNADTLAAVGVSENDALMYMTCMLPDPKEINAQGIRNIIAAQPAKRVGVDMLKAWLMNIYESYFVFGALVLGAVMLAGIVVIAAGKKYLLEYVAVAASCVVMGTYFQYAGRWNHRLAYALLLSVLMVLMYLHTDIKSESQNLAVVLIVVVFCIAGLWLKNRFDYNSYMRDKAVVDIDILKAHLQENQDTLFCYDTFTVQDSFKYDVFKAAKEGSMSNLVSCGNWLQESPIVKEQLGRYGFDSPFEALKAGDGRVVLIDNCYPNEKALYLTEHSAGHQYTAEFAENIGGFNTYTVK